MQRLRATIAGLTVAAFIVGTAGVASARGDVADKQGYCKKQGSSACAGQSECSTNHQEDLPPGQRKRCG
jgi:hypothetical protein